MAFGMQNMAGGMFGMGGRGGPPPMGMQNPMQARAQMGPPPMRPGAMPMGAMPQQAMLRPPMGMQNPRMQGPMMGQMNRPMMRY